jgi:gliding motility-associated-like protein
MLLRILLYALLTFSLMLRVYGQTVSIQSDDYVCLNELLVLQSDITGTASTYNWDFGDNSSSTQNNTIHSYSQIGTKDVKLTVVFTDGTTVSDSKTIMVHDLPVADFEIVNTSLCFNQHEICIKDKSSMGQTTSGYSSRLILWGDGNQNANTNPSIGDEICYSQYPNVGNYTLDVEVVNDKGCEDKWEYDFTLLKDYVASFDYTKFGAECNAQEVCLNNDSATAPSDVDTWEWDFGDGTKLKGDWNSNCHTYTSSGSYTATLTVKLQNGCESTYTQTFTVSFPEVKTDVKLKDSVLCFPQRFYFVNPPVPGGSYYWVLYDKNKSILKIAGTQRDVYIGVPCPEDYYVRLIVNLGNCNDTSEYFKIQSLGVSASYLPLNRRQCSLEDTVYFANFTKSHPDARPEYLWYFDDDNASNCIGFPSNCNYDTSFNSQHFYTDTGCYTTKLIVTDPVSGCVDSTTALVSIEDTDNVNFKFEMELPCIGRKAEYGVRFSHDACDLAIEVCEDSLKNDKDFRGLIPGLYRYDWIADTSGWVTVGFAIEGGSDKIYRSVDTSDYYIDTTRLCFDTVWYHNWFQMFPEPLIDFVIEKDSQCLPIKVDLKYLGTEDDKIEYMKYVWEPGIPITSIQVRPDTVPDISHIYTEEGNYSIFVLLQDTIGCYDYTYFEEKFGYLNSFRLDTLICIGDTITFYDSLRYWGDYFPYWEQEDVPEKMWWNFGDGGGFDSTNHAPSYLYTSKGKYKVQLASVDVNGCADTVTKYVTVTGVNADIFNKNEDYLCDQIVQFFDSSYFDLKNNPDNIVKYYWDFGDYKTPSYLRDPYHYYSSNGAFTVTHAVESAAGCVDTAEFDIYLRGPIPYFDITSDTVGCVPYTAQFKSNSANFSSLIWHMGDSAKTTIYADKDSTVNFTYNKPGTYYIYLEGSDSFYNEDTKNSYTCTSVFPDTNAFIHAVRRIVVLPIPEADFSFNGPVCVGQPLVLENQSNQIYDIYNWLVETTDTTTTISTYSHVFSDTGTYIVRFNPSYIPEGPYERECYDSISKIVHVTKIIANFNFVPDGNCSEFNFTDSSFKASSYRWDFGHAISGDDNFSDLQNPTHKYGKDTGTFNVCLIVSNDSGCLDTACNEVVAEYYEELILYNIFSPNGDRYNEEFFFSITNYRYYNLKIFNRWGENVFQTTNPEEGWNGKYSNQGEDLPVATYFYVLQYGYNCDHIDHVVEGMVELIR